MYPEEIILFIFDILIFFCAFHEFVLVCLCHDARNLFYIFFHYFVVLVPVLANHVRVLHFPHYLLFSSYSLTFQNRRSWQIMFFSSQVDDVEFGEADFCCADLGFDCIRCSFE